ncbi:MAG: hypothetical protein P1V51_16305 [Deltaproteobacteria bacterium]|nr:hypothetical protein [Deltaproteobacteria bacterium]
MPASDLSFEALREPPRRVSLGARIVVLFSGTVQLIGWAFLAMGLIGTAVFVGNADLGSFLLDEEDARRRPGELVAIEGTSASVNEQPVMALRARYPDGRGEQQEVVSYVTGGYDYQVGQAVTVLDFPDHPEAAVIVGARRSLFGAAVLFVLLFPIIGLAFVVTRLRVQGRWQDLLVHGEATRAVLKLKKPTNTRINEQPVYELVFEYFDRQGSDHTFSVRTHETAALEDESTEAILFDPRKPARAVPLDLIGAHLQQDASDGIVAASAGRVIGLLLRPGIALMVFLAWLLLA